MALVAGHGQVTVILLPLHSFSLLPLKIALGLIYRLIKTLIWLGRLACIMVDEIHLLEKHKPFRPCMGSLSFLGLLAVSIILTTATCPPSLEKTFFERLERKVYHVI
jgi:CRISPR/Cas system-associated endonuclease/helicase Cas3